MGRVNWATVILVLGMLITGSINTVSKKIGYDTCSEGLDGVNATSGATNGCHDNERKFRKPWTQTLVMFLGETVCLFLFFFRRYRSSSRDGKAGLNLAAISESGRVRLSSALVCLLPAVCDLGGTTLSGIGLLFTPASVFQMLRGSIIIFTAVFSVLFLKRKVYGYQWFGISITVCGIALVGTSSYLNSSHNSTSTGVVMLGNGLVILSQIMSAFQMVVEEKYLKKLQLPPEFVVGCEGVFGAVLMLAVVLPFVYHIPFHTCTKDWCKDGNGIHEDALDAVELMSNNGLLLFVVLLYWFSIAFYNFCGLAVARSLSSVHRTLIDACRTVIVWTVGIILHYSTDGRYGEKWKTTPGMIQLTGFTLMVFGTMVHNKIIKLPSLFYYPPPAGEPLLTEREDVTLLETRDERRS